MTEKRRSDQLNGSGRADEGTGRFNFGEGIVILRDAAGECRCYDYAVRELGRLLRGLGISSSVQAGQGGTTGRQVQIVPGQGPGRGDLEGAAEVEPGTNGFVLDVAKCGVGLVAQESKGILNGVYMLAEWLGYLFLFPGDQGEWPPVNDRADVSVPVQRRVMRPRFSHCGLFMQGELDEDWVRYCAKLRFDTVAHDGNISRDLAEELGLRVEKGGHGIDEYIDPSLFEQEPEMFRMAQPEDFGGRRNNDHNFCVTSPPAKALVGSELAERLGGFVDERLYAVHIWPADLPGGGWCLCSCCRWLSASDQAMLATRMFAEVIGQQNAAVRIAHLAYQDTLFPGRLVGPPAEAFLLFAPRERCYGHSLGDGSCALNQEYCRALGEWMARFPAGDDAHSFEYYCDRVLYRGLDPFLPGVVIDDASFYRERGIKTHLCLRVAGGQAAEFSTLNMVALGRACWEDAMDADGFISWLADRLVPEGKGVMDGYLKGRARIYNNMMRLCRHDREVWFDYRFLPGTTGQFGQETVAAYGDASIELGCLAEALEAGIAGSWPARSVAWAKREAVRTRFEAAEVKVMMLQQDAENHIAEYLSAGCVKALSKAVALFGQALDQVYAARESGKAVGFPKGHYHHTWTKWLEKELTEKCAKWQQAYENKAKETDGQDR